jgi:hypothetical protein
MLKLITLILLTVPDITARDAVHIALFNDADQANVYKRRHGPRVMSFSCKSAVERLKKAPADYATISKQSGKWTDTEFTGKDTLFWDATYNPKAGWIKKYTDCLAK